mgnify:CR=1 FL=1
MEPAIVARGGFVDSYIGDAIMALFEVAPASAVGAAVDMHRQLRPLNAQRVARGLRPIHIGVGLNTLLAATFIGAAFTTAFSAGLTAVVWSRRAH